MDRVHFSSVTDKWPTPVAVYAELDKEFHFDFDPCPSHGAADTLFDGLRISWAGRRVYCNPPYGAGVERWLILGLDAQLAVFLLPVRTDTKWFHDIVLPKAREIRFLKGRLKFGEAVDGAPFPSMLVVFGG